MEPTEQIKKSVWRLKKVWTYYLILTSFIRPESMKEASNVSTKIREGNNINLALFKEDPGP